MWFSEAQIQVLLSSLVDCIEICAQLASKYSNQLLDKNCRCSWAASIVRVCSCDKSKLGLCMVPCQCSITLQFHSLLYSCPFLAFHYPVHIAAYPTDIVFQLAGCCNIWHQSFVLILLWLSKQFHDPNLFVIGWPEYMRILVTNTSPILDFSHMVDWKN